MISEPSRKGSQPAMKNLHRRSLGGSFGLSVANKALNTFPAVTGTVTQWHASHIVPFRHCPLALR